MCLGTDHLLLENQLVCSSLGKIISLTVSIHLLIAYSSLAEAPGLSLVHANTSIVRPENVRTGIKILNKNYRKEKVKKKILHTVE